MSLSRQSSASSISSSGSDFEDYYPIRDSPITYKDEPYYYDGISDEELHSHLNDGFEYVINLNKYGIAFSSKDILNDEGGDYIYYDVEEREARNIAILNSQDIFDDIPFDENVGPPMYDCKYDSRFSLFKRQ